jgi:hypothetical protein
MKTMLRHIGNGAGLVIDKAGTAVMIAARDNV